MSKGGSLAPLAEIRLAFGLETPTQMISLYDIKLLILAEKEIRAAEIPVDRAIPTLEQVIHVVETTPSPTAIEKRNRALFAFIASTGTRYAAAVTLRLKHLDPSPEFCDPEPEGGQTKSSKQICAFLLPVDDNLKSIFLDWVQHLKNDLLFGNDDPRSRETCVLHE